MPSLSDIQAAFKTGPFVPPLELGPGDVSLYIYEVCRTGLVVDARTESGGLRGGTLSFDEQEGLAEAVDFFLERTEAEDVSWADGHRLTRTAGEWRVHGERLTLAERVAAYAAADSTPT